MIYNMILKSEPLQKDMQDEKMCENEVSSQEMAI